MWDFPDYESMQKARAARRLKRRAENKAAWAANRLARERMQAFAADTKRIRRKRQRPYWRYLGPAGGYKMWNELSRWAGRAGVPRDVLKPLRERYMPHWIKGDPIPRAVCEAIITEALRIKGERRLAKLGFR